MADAVLTATAGRVLVITLNRPEVKNAIDSDMSLGVLDALATLDADHELRVGVLTGAGGSFCAGMDLKAFARSGLPTGIDDIYRNGCRKPLVAAIEGVARRRRARARADRGPPRRRQGRHSSARPRSVSGSSRAVAPSCASRGTCPNRSWPSSL